MPVGGVNGINLVTPAINNQNVLQENENTTVSFSDYLNDALTKVNDLQIEAEQVADDFAAGKIDNIHEVTIAAEKADIALQFTMQIRNKILDAYNEIMRMQI